MRGLTRQFDKVFIVPTFSDMAAGLVGAIRQEIKLASPSSPFKAIVFAPAARLVDFYTEVLQKIRGFPSVTAIHSRMTQNRRSKITDAQLDYIFDQLRYEATRYDAATGIFVRTFPSWWFVTSLTFS